MTQRKYRGKAKESLHIIVQKLQQYGKKQVWRSGSMYVLFTLASRKKTAYNSRLMGRVQYNRPRYPSNDDTASNLTTSASIIAYLEENLANSNLGDQELLLTAKKIHKILERTLQGKTPSKSDESGAQNQ